MFFYLYVFAIGLIIGSFINVVIHRVPEGKTIVYGRSHCPNCHKVLGWYDLFPVISYLMLGGKCRYCSKKISFIYPAIELYSGVIFFLSYWFFSQSGYFYWIYIAFILELFLILAVIDFRHLILPDGLLIALLAGTFVFSAASHYFKFYGVWVFGLNNLIGALLLFLSFFIIWLVSKGRGIGLGDAKLAAIIGLIFGFWEGFIILYIAVAVGALLGLALLLTRKAELKTKLPLGTLICASSTVFVFIGGNLISRLSVFFYAIPLIFR